MYGSNHGKHIQRLGKRRGARRKRSIVDDVCDETFVLKIFMFLSLGVFLVGLVLCVRQVTMPSSAHEHVHYHRNATKVSPTNLRSGVINFPHFGSSKLDIENYKPAGGGRYPEWALGDTPYASTPSIKKKSDALARERRVAIKNAMVFAWGGYKKNAFGCDELKPVTGKCNHQVNAIGTTLVDSLDTLWLMGLREEFDEARDWVRDKLSHDHNMYLSSFETTIRSLGGLLAAYDWSGDAAFLEKAEDLGYRLLKAFDTKSGLPWNEVNLKTGAGKNERGSSETNLASAGSLQVEFRFLAHATGNKEYAEKPERAFDLLRSLKPEDGLYADSVRNTLNEPAFGTRTFVTFGARGDSFYEYMLKLWLQGGKSEVKYRDMYDESIEGMHKVLLQYTSKSQLAYIAQKEDRKRKGKVSASSAPPPAASLIHDMEHLECFMGGE